MQERKADGDMNTISILEDKESKEKNMSSLTVEAYESAGFWFLVGTVCITAIFLICLMLYDMWCVFTKRKIK